MNQQYIAQISELSHCYGKTNAVNNVNLDIPSGCMVGLIGPDGVGKSTLLAIISGVRKIQQGTVTVLDGNIAHKRFRKKICPRIAYMPQGLGHNLYMTLSVFENVDFFGRLFGLSQDERTWRIQELLESTGLLPFIDRPAGKLSGGMKQKLGLCCALIHDPQLLILDEPTTGVDPLSRRQFWELIELIRSRRSDMSVIVATAYMDEADKFDWLIAMDAGNILAYGTPDELKQKTNKNNLEAAFIALLPIEKRSKHKALTIPQRKQHSENTAIEARNLTRKFDSFTAVDNVSFRIERGEIFGFLGSNGCGKTTTMKMLTGLLPASEGDALLFGETVNVNDIKTRKRVGYMSQSFSLYTELTVRQNLALHARIFHIPKQLIPQRVEEMVQRFGLTNVIDELTEKLPMGIRQRLSLAVAVIHQPEMLILDEPTSGVDPIARDQFWELLIQLSREDGVTIFISTHFMHEAERCDRISLMHAGKVLAQGVPEQLVQEHGSESLEETFISYLQESVSDKTDSIKTSKVALENSELEVKNKEPSNSIFNLTRAWAYARRERMEIQRDPIRLGFALLGPIILMIAFGYGITFDTENLSYAVLDRDQTPESRNYLENFTGSRYFVQQIPISSYTDLDDRLRKGQLSFGIEIPPDFGKDIKRGRPAEVGIWIDGTNPARADNARGYILAIHQFYLEQLAHNEYGQQPQSAYRVETRFRYNQDFKSVYAIVPGTIMMLLVWIPAMMTAAGVVREKEMGSITNLYATPVSGLEFLLGKQFPYIIIALMNFACFILLALLLFQVPIKGSVMTLLLGGLFYVIATTGLGLLISSFMKTQIAAIFGAAIITTTPAVNFSGLFSPVASLTEGAQIFSHSFPSHYFQQISIGTFTKSLRLEDLTQNFMILTLLIAVYLTLSLVFLKTQER